MTKIDARGITVNYSPADSPIDALHRVTKRTYSNGDTPATYCYDLQSCTTLPIQNGIGRRVSVTDGSGSSAWSYDVLGRIRTARQTILGVTKTIGYDYNLAGSPIAITYPSGRRIDYTYNAATRQVSAVDSANTVNYALNARYWPHGALRTALFGNDHGHGGSTLTQTFNSRLQPLTIRAANSSRTIIDFTYSFNLGAGNNGNVSQIINNRDNTRSQTFTYDALNRLATAETTSSSLWANAYQYDVWGNLNKMLPYNGKPEGQHFDQISNTKNQLVGYSYDLAGNLLNDGLGHSFTYDAENRIVSTAGTTYTYDGDGQRVAKSGYRLYWWGMAVGGSLAETLLGGTDKREYIYFAGRRIALVDLSVSGNNCMGIPPDCHRYYFYPDHLGSTSVLASTDGGTTQYEADFYPFGGERVITTSSISTPYRFTSKERDSESNLDYFGARYFGSSLGRFTVPDEPFTDQNEGDPQSWNLYSYVRNNPLVNVDPTGAICQVNSTDNTVYDDGHGAPCQEVDEKTAEAPPSAEVQAQAEAAPIFVAADFNPTNDRAPLAFQGFVNLFVNRDVRRGVPQLAIGLLPGAALRAAAARLGGPALFQGFEAAANARLAQQGLSASAVFNAGKGVLQGETTGMTQHALNQALVRGVTQPEIAEALTHVAQGTGGSVLRFIGQAAEVRVNQITGKIVTVIRFKGPGG